MCQLQYVHSIYNHEQYAEWLKSVVQISSAMY